MVRSYWRKAHLLLALIASLFLIIASVTGVILSFEPVSNRLHESHIGNAEDGSLGSLIHQLESTYLEVIEIKIDENQLLTISVIDDDGEFQTFHANPNTGKKVQSPYKESAVFSFSRTLHRSLFYGTTGRLLVGVTAFLLIFIALSGCILVIKRQLGIQRFFSKVRKENKDMYWHVVIGRWSLPLLLMIALTGTLLSLDRFVFFPEEKEIKHAIDFDSMSDVPQLEKQQFTLFQTTQLADVEWVQFPFSPDIEDYYHLRLSDREIIVNQFNGSSISEVGVDASSEFQQLIFNLHTGKTSAIWSLILGLASLSILVFIFTGCRIYIKRKRRKTKGSNPFSKDECSVILLSGSEGGATAERAMSAFRQLLDQSVKVYIDELNHYQRYENMEHLLIFTSTYGDGEAPSNAYLFPEKFAVIHPTRPFTYSIVGFGSTNYRQFCQFAHDLDDLLQGEAQSQISLTTINEQSTEELNAWGKRWSASMGLKPLSFSEKQAQPEEEDPTFMFYVTGNSAREPEPETSFQLTLTSPNITCRSGDLLAIQPSPNDRERLYSLGKNKDGDLYVSIKLHEHGECSNALSLLKPGDVMSAKIQSNKAFHFPENASSVIGICNGTGIAPFIGMANENLSKKRFDLYWGGRTQHELDKYANEIEYIEELGQLSSFQFTLSREATDDFTYVQDLIQHNEIRIARALSEGAVLMICGSISMRNDLLNVLRSMCEKHLTEPFEAFETKGQIRIDCY